MGILQKSFNTFTNEWVAFSTDTTHNQSGDKVAHIDIHNLQLWRMLAEQSGYRVNLLSKQLGISRRQLQRYTQTVFGLSPQHWLNNQRMLIAADLLKKHRSVKVVTFSVGFKQVSHFSREFKLYHGMCPVAFLTKNDLQERKNTLNSP
jgi:AraC-like DNA-binding protein